MRIVLDQLVDNCLLMVTFVTVVFVNNVSPFRMVGIYGFAKAPENFRRTEIFYLYYNYTCSTFY